MNTTVCTRVSVSLLCVSERTERYRGCQHCCRPRGQRSESWQTEPGCGRETAASAAGSVCGLPTLTDTRGQRQVEHENSQRDTDRNKDRGEEEINNNTMRIKLFYNKNQRRTNTWSRIKETQSQLQNAGRTAGKNLGSSQCVSYSAPWWHLGEIHYVTTT